MREKFNATLFMLSLAVACCIGAIAGSSGLPRAMAAPTQTDRVAAATGSVASSAGIAAVPTSSGYRIACRAITLHSGSAGLVTLRDGNTAGSVLAYVYLEANKSLTLDELALGGGIRSTRGNCIWAMQPASATLSITARYNEE